MPPQDRPASHAPLPRRRVLEVAGVFARLGFTAFGGPAAHVALMEDEIVRRRGWVDRQHFLDLLATVNFIPGPNSTEMAIHLGLIRAGWAGLVVAGVCFILPAVLIILPLAWLYVTYGSLPQVQGVLHGINACIVAIVAAAMWRFARTGIKDPFTAGIAALATVAGFVAPRFGIEQSELLILAAAALAGGLWYARPRIPRLPLLSIGVPLAVLPATVPALTLSAGLMTMSLIPMRRRDAIQIRGAPTHVG